MRSSEYKSEQRAPFDLICDAAKAKTMHERESLLTNALKHACIDVWDDRYVTPVCVLAAQGEVAAVNFLLSHGASYGFAGSGYASVGNNNEVNALLALIENDPFQLDFFLKQTTYGYTFCNDPKQLEVFLDKIKRDYSDKFAAVLPSQASGFAKNNKIDAAYDVLRKTQKKFPDEMGRVLIALADGFAYINNMAEVKKVFKLKLSKSVSEEFSMCKAVFICLAERGFEESMELFKDFVYEDQTV